MTTYRLPNMYKLYIILNINVNKCNAGLDYDYYYPTIGNIYLMYSMFLISGK